MTPTNEPEMTPEFVAWYETHVPQGVEHEVDDAVEAFGVSVLEREVKFIAAAAWNAACALKSAGHVT
jgi:hypothetical protein